MIRIRKSLIMKCAAAIAAAALLALSGCASDAPSATPPAVSDPPAVSVPPAPSDTAEMYTAETLPEAADGDIRVLFINAGKADAILITTDGGSYMIDTGEKKSIDAVLTALDAMHVARLDGVFLTHTHSDHMGGMKKLAEAVPVDMMYAASITELTDKGNDKFEKLSEKTGVPLTRLDAGDDIDIGGATAHVIAPLILNTDDDNDNSLVLIIEANGRRLLFTGDMQFAEEETLLLAGTDVSADVLKVGNHGNPDATSAMFARAAAPSLAFITTDTAVDADSANPAVIARVGAANTYITQNYALGVLLTVSKSGEMSVFGIA